MECAARLESGRGLWVDVRFWRARLDGEERILALVRDVDERHRAEVRYREVVETATDAVFGLDADGRFEFFSPAIEGISGWAPEELYGRSFLEMVLPEDREPATAAFRDGMAGSRAAHEFRVTDRVGRVRWIRVSARRVEREGGGVGLTGLLSEISELRRVRQRQSELEEQLRHSQKMEALGRLAGGVAHDFNNLLLVIRNYASMLRRAHPEGAAERHWAAEVEQAAERAAALTRQLLAFSRPVTAVDRSEDLAALVRDMEAMLRRMLDEDVACAVHLPAEPLLVPVPGEHLVQVLLNLAANARDAMPHGGRFEVSATVVDGPDGAGRVRLVVRDTGEGMTPEVLERAFEPFFTTKTQGQGSGLGLATVYGIVRQAGGQIALHSTPGAGTTVEIEFPRVAGPAAEPPEEEPGRPTPLPGTVLVVEDEPAVRRLVVRMLREAAYDVLEADGAPAALEVMRARGPLVQLLVTDVVMPGVNGRVLAERLSGEFPNLRVLFMSGHLGGTATEPPSPLLAKPFGRDELLARVHDALVGPPWRR